MKPDRGRMAQAVADALDAATGDDRDGAAAALATRYAELIDEAQRVADRLDEVAAELDGTDDPLYDVVHRLRAKVDAQAVASDLGPKLLAALTALGLTVAGRQGVTKGGASGGTGRADARRSALDELRARRSR